ncbi:MAG TPA: hypothetical protein VEB18_02355 [Candidatus Paceibacterota bacterium]|nr:hypothetical protein [Candidatus Paceibacterota bacterium]
MGFLKFVLFVIGLAAALTGVFVFFGPIGPFDWLFAIGVEPEHVMYAIGVLAAAGGLTGFIALAFSLNTTDAIPLGIAALVLLAFSSVLLVNPVGGMALPNVLYALMLGASASVLLWSSRQITP